METALRVKLREAHKAVSLGDLSHAEEQLQELLLENPHELDALDLLGYVLYFLHRPDEAEKACRRALAIAPERAYSNKGLGLCLAKQGKVTEGTVYLRKAIKLEPNWFDPRWDLAITLAAANRFEEALEVLVEAEASPIQGRAKYAALRRQILERLNAHHDCSDRLGE